MPRSRVTDIEALAYDCPLCGQVKGEPCVYAPIVNAAKNSTRPAVIGKLARVGTPTVKVHNERRRVVHRMHAQQFQAMLTNARVQHKHTAQEAATRWQMQEEQRLRAWLHQFGSILWN